MVSVVVPVYNTQRYLNRCLDALVMQTIDPSMIEIIAVNDGSTDGSLDILKEYEKKYPDRVRVFSKPNGGQATARNFGIEVAKGDYIGFADSDDYVDTSMFEKMYLTAERTGADLVECDYHSMLELDEKDADGLPLYKEIGTRGKISAHDNPRELFLDPQVSPWNKLYKKELLTGRDIRFPVGMIYEDTAFYIKTIPYIKKQEYIDEKLVYYSVRKNSTMTANLGKRVGDIFKVFDDILCFYKDKDLFDEYRKELEYFCVKIAFCSNFSRIGRVNDKDLRSKLFEETFSFVKNNFKDYKKNNLFSGKIGMYIRSVNRLNCRPYAKVLSKVMIG